MFLLLVLGVSTTPTSQLCRNNPRIRQRKHANNTGQDSQCYQAASIAVRAYSYTHTPGININTIIWTMDTTPFSVATLRERNRSSHGHIRPAPLNRYLRQNNQAWAWKESPEGKSHGLPFRHGARVYEEAVHGEGMNPLFRNNLREREEL
ncbi:MAG: hypothetical protein JOS17DRAFT_727394 [Linnemannia elongata]|nr:MAG: hypothetical protein JOS17DRAFT_727394 [Linnemannia elongata]